MDAKNKTPAQTPGDTVNQVKILSTKNGSLKAQAEFATNVGEESTGFDPYDTASLYVSKSADEQ